MQGLRPVYVTEQEAITIESQPPRPIEKLGKIYYNDGLIYVTSRLKGVQNFINQASPGVHFIQGISSYVSNKMLLEGGYFAGVRIREQYNNGIPDDAELASTRSNGILGEGKFILPGIGFYFRLGFNW